MGMKYRPMAFLSRWHSYPGSFDRENDRECLNWRLYAGSALVEVADLAISTVVIILVWKTKGSV